MITIPRQGSIIDLTNVLVDHALDNKATVLLLCWDKFGTRPSRVLMQVGQKLEAVAIPRSLIKSVMSRIKLMAGLSISDRGNIQQASPVFKTRGSGRVVHATAEVVAIPAIESEPETMVLSFLS